MSYHKNVKFSIAFRMDNTEGYTESQLDDLNNELGEELEGLQIHSDEWYQIAKNFQDKVARR